MQETSSKNRKRDVESRKYEASCIAEHSSTTTPSEIALRLQRHAMTWKGTLRPLRPLCEINDNPPVIANIHRQPPIKTRLSSLCALCAR